MKFVNTPFVDVHSHSCENVGNVVKIYNMKGFELDADCLTKGRLSAGIHPWYIQADKLPEEFINLEKLLLDDRVIAIGETGIDRVCSVDLDLQKQVFLKHWELAGRMQKPMIIHCVRAYSDMLGMCKINKNMAAMVFHGFDGNEQIVNELLKYDVGFSFGHQLLNAGSKAQKVINNVPDDRLFFETDDSSLSILAIYRQAAEIKNCSLDVLKNKVLENYNRFFGEYL